MVVVNTYVPNNGTTPQSFKRRREWNATALEFAERCRNKSKVVVWIGDLNTTHTFMDVTQPDRDFFFKQGSKTADPGDRGQPGYTPNEQLAFDRLLQTGQLVDAFRHMHPQVSQLSDDPHWSWRGAGAVHVAHAKYFGKGMRIDYSLVSKELQHSIMSADILGSGKERTGAYPHPRCRCDLVVYGLR
jgi:AP endonuclease-1